MLIFPLFPGIFQAVPHRRQKHLPETETADEDFRPEKALEHVRYVEAWYMKAKPTSIVATMIVTLLSGKITAICRAWKKTWIKRWLQNF